MTVGLVGALVGAEFHPPGTEDFVYGCYVGDGATCFNFPVALVAATVLIVLGLFYFAFRAPTVVPGKLQSVMEMGMGFVREQVAMPMLGHDADRFLPLLVAFFFYIVIGNLFEVAPMVNFSHNSRVAFPLVLGVISWLVYNYQGMKKHGVFGYLKFVCIIGSAPPLLRYTLLPPIEFVTGIVMRPLTLAVRLTANFVAGHFLLAVFFLGTEFFILNGPKTWAFAAVSFPLAVILVAFEVFVSLLQAFIFTILTASYIGGAMAEDH
ncbi:MAG: F0F1 ATP synthase subunit A [Actinomycetota bacterium]